MHPRTCVCVSGVVINLRRVSPSSASGNNYDMTNVTVDQEVSFVVHVHLISNDFATHT